MVAPSFQTFIKVSEPYKENGRMYISVQHPVTNKVRKVRWYTDIEYRKSFPNSASPEEQRKGLSNQKVALGFEKGYIHLFKGEYTEDNIGWFEINKEIRYNVHFGWFLPSTEECPAEMPEGFELVRLNWDTIANQNGDLVSKSKVEEAVSALLYPPSNSEFCGVIGERIEKEVVVISKKVKETDYGLQYIHIFADSAENSLGWATTAKSLEVGKTYIIRGTVKAHTTFRNIKTTWLTRCMICD